MAERSFTRIKARDGLEIPTYITRPISGKGPWPAVVLVHGGPWVRGGDWEWEAEAQFLASRGYLVVEPEFRGSTGFGARHFRAGFKQWGLAMQDDLADAALWAVQQGLADRARIAIAGPTGSQPNSSSRIHCNRTGLPGTARASSAASSATSSAPLWP